METVTILTRAVPNIFSLNDLEWLWLLQKYFQRHGTWRTLPLLRQPITARHSSLCCRMNRKGKSLINNISIGRFCGINSYNRCSNHRMVSFDTDTALQSFYHSFIVLPMIRCSKLAQKSAVQVKKGKRAYVLREIHPRTTGRHLSNGITQCYLLPDRCVILLAVWLSGNTLASINVVALRQTRLVLGWVTVCGRVNHIGM